MSNRRFDPESYLDEEFDPTLSRWHPGNDADASVAPIRATLPGGEEVGIYSDASPNIGTEYSYGGETYRTVRIHRDLGGSRPQWVIDLDRQ